jgi:hypothetical protein
VSARRGRRSPLGTRRRAAGPRCFATLRAVTRAVVVVVAMGALTVTGTAAAADPLAGLVLDDASGRAWHLDGLEGGPVLLVITDRQGSKQANDWGERLAARTLPLAPWRAAGKVAWLSVADLRRVPDYARGAARDQVREREEGRGQTEQRQCSSILLDWKGLLAERFQVARGEALIVLLSPDHRALIHVRGAPTDEAVARLVEAITSATTR